MQQHRICHTIAHNSLLTSLASTCKITLKQRVSTGCSQVRDIFCQNFTPWFQGQIYRAHGFSATFAFKNSQYQSNPTIKIVLKCRYVMLAHGLIQFFAKLQSMVPQTYLPCYIAHDLMFFFYIDFDVDFVTLQLEVLEIFSLKLLKFQDKVGKFVFGCQKIHTTAQHLKLFFLKTLLVMVSGSDLRCCS